MQINLEKTDVEGLVTVEAEDNNVLNLLASYLARKDVIGFVDSYELEPTDELASRAISDLKEHVTLSFTAIGNPDFETSLRNLKDSLIEAISGESEREELEHVLNSQWSIFFDYTEQFNDEAKDRACIICNKIFDYNDFAVNELQVSTVDC